MTPQENDSDVSERNTKLPRYEACDFPPLGPAQMAAAV